MTIWAGVDIGNATTEVVLCREGTELDVLASARTPTRGGKGSSRAIQGAAQLARRLADTHGLVIDRAAFAPTPPVHSSVERVKLETRRTGRLTIATRSAATTAGDAVGVGVPVPVELLDEVDPDGPVVACATREWGYREVAGAVNAAVADGRNVVAVLTANDEAVLVSNRLRAALPVVDDVDVPQLLSATLVAVEVRQGVAPLQRLTDPFWLADVFGLQEDERVDARVVADQLFDSACAVVCLDSTEPATPAPRIPEPAVPSGEQAELTHIIHLADVAAQANSRRGSVVVDSLVMATMGGEEAPPAGADELGEALGVAVTRIDSEAAAARVGALTTPGVIDGVVVVDVGGGTVDVVTDGSRLVLPGAGQLLTTATATALDISRSAAEYAKRMEAVTAVTVQLVEDEHGRRQFLDKPINGRCTGWLLTSAPSGLLPFTSRMSGTEWRSWRLAAKRLVIGGNVMRGIEQVAPGATGVLLVGGGASDDELVRAVSEQLGHEVSVGRGNVAGQLGHRFAVAYGLVVMAARL
ncbi:MULTISPECIES: diol dehydratase reactivase ATPase-like domain-containing protein [unclassified Mycolicibacterium]|uniref:diol dehydratase reactivase ATPase-like domain-containing protein n=2 Tax=Mycolicibacterium TaxID=1866885 RepID=UPI0012DEABF7|nr:MULTISPECIES: diol dehydratase reactivase ATPase-like domain-containing protein [unclassified Mycolicibacterium]MUL85626.1 diol dehydratase reactivase [Mycolicibacterium sp. CBMA 329]MUL88610.1 diol dehydratase reactivase [Mycolicibacterium sp. CBMA 331]MUM02094.1 diol dehydratase reactivase [Mycolicibacterium sp. CBMA 334]MUM40257.1 diol dehydratase reactivase [Mycolicibacterium sp. CBMA 247]MUM44674.1 diol dehydratase reactivase [Mycolicibacterium sp. CBMA 294]